jgi:adenylosuccinate lyase
LDHNMIERYSTEQMTAIWSDLSKISRWLEVELLATESHARLGLVPTADAEHCRANAPQVDEGLWEEILAREEITNHDVAAFVDVIQQRIGGAPAAWIHYGLTSTDVVDTALCWALRDASDTLIEAAVALVSQLVAMAQEHRDTPMIGRTHGVHAEPTTFGAKVALWAMQVERDRQRLIAARDAVAVMKLSGAVGTYSNIDPAVEADVAAALGLRPVPATQVIARDRHAEFLWACASVGTTCELIAVELRHLQRTEVSEVQEGFRPGQKGSSAMPHKRNPISAETISGLSRILRSNLQAGMQDVALWHERDISHSSVERVILPDSAQLAHYVLGRTRRLLEGLVINTERMLTNLWSSHGLVFSQPVLLALVGAGLSRDEAYRIVQSAAATAWDHNKSFREILNGNPEVAALGADALEEAFDLSRALRHAGKAVDALTEVLLP